MSAIAWWAFGYAMELAFVNEQIKILWAKLEYFSIVSLPAIWLIMVLQYIGKKEWITRRNILLLSIEPAIVLFLVWTNEFHHLIWKNIDVISINSMTLLQVTHGVAFWLNVVYSYILLFFTFFLLIHALFYLPSIYKKQIVALIFGILAPWIGNALYIFNLNPFEPIDLTPFAIFVSGLAATLAVLRLRFLDIVPVARETIIENMEDGVIILDIQNRIVDANPATEKILGYPISKAIGQPIDEFFKNNPELLEHFKKNETEKEIFIGNENKRYYVLRSSPLLDKQYHKVGRLLILRDITKHKMDEIKIKRLNEELQLMNKIMRHDIATDLQVIQGLLELYFEDKDKQLLEKAAKRIEKSINLIRRMRDAELLATSGLKMKEYNIRGVVENVAKNYPIDFNLKGECIVRADDAIYSVIDNIIGNAVLHGKTDRIDVIIEDRDSICEIRIADYGKGIPDEIKDKIFEKRFSYGEWKGSGLGLYIVKKIIERYGGSINVEDNEPNGAVFIIKLKK